MDSRIVSATAPATAAMGVMKQSVAKGSTAANIRLERPRRQRSLGTFPAMRRLRRSGSSVTQEFIENGQTKRAARGSFIRLFCRDSARISERPQRIKSIRAVVKVKPPAIRQHAN